MILNESGIYAIINEINNHIYIGSATNLRSRRNAHFGDLRRQSHRNLHLQRAFNKYGEDSLNFHVVEIIEKNRLIDAEQKWIDFFNPEYNIIKRADRKEFSDEHRLRLSNAHKGKKHTEESKRRIGAKSRGNKYRLGKKWSESERERRSKIVYKQRERGPNNPLYGKKRPTEVIKKIIETRLFNQSKLPIKFCHCGIKAKSRNMCNKHYKRAWRRKRKNNENFI